MRCEDALLLISGHLDHANTGEEEAALQAHLSVCAECRNVLLAFETVDAELSSLDETAPEGLCADVMAQIKKETNKKRRRPWYGIAIAAALALVIGVSATVDIHDGDDAPQTVSVFEAEHVSRALPAANGETLAQKIADERKAAIAVVDALHYEIETYPCETLEEGCLLYCLPDRETVSALEASYGCEVYEPTEVTDVERFYALLIP